MRDRDKQTMLLAGSVVFLAIAAGSAAVISLPAVAPSLNNTVPNNIAEQQVTKVTRISQSVETVQSITRDGTASPTADSDRATSNIAEPTTQSDLTLPVREEEGSNRGWVELTEQAEAMVAKMPPDSQPVEMPEELKAKVATLPLAVQYLINLATYLPDRKPKS